jgi:hypothetical protein
MDPTFVESCLIYRVEQVVVNSIELIVASFASAAAVVVALLMLKMMLYYLIQTLMLTTRARAVVFVVSAAAAAAASAATCYCSFLIHCWGDRLMKVMMMMISRRMTTMTWTT